MHSIKQHIDKLIMKKTLSISFFYFLFFTAFAQQEKIPLPSKQQLAWHEMEFYWFIHFGPNTFTDKEWGHGDEPEDIFNPTALDCRQWARIAKQSGAKGIIITAKHHDGFCLWPSAYSAHTVAQSKWGAYRLIRALFFNAPSPERCAKKMVHHGPNPQMLGVCALTTTPKCVGCGLIVA
jgi:hypothetical protein